MAREQGYELHSFSFRYGQRHERELVSAQKIANFLQARPHKNCFRSSRDRWLFADRPIEVPKGRSAAEFPGHSHHLRATRDTISSLSLSRLPSASTRGGFFQRQSTRYNGDPDCRVEYVQAFERMANLTTRLVSKAGSRSDLLPEIGPGGRSVPDWSSDLTRPHLELLDPPAEGRACGRCDSCQLKLKDSKRPARLILSRRRVIIAAMR